MSIDTPLLLIAWKRPDTLARLIDALRQVRPSNIFIAVDGPKPDVLGQRDLVLRTREVVEKNIDWPCTIHRLYSDINHGCRVGVSRAINWFFESTRVD